MDSVFGIGLPELILVAVLAGMVMGPERIVRVARTLGLMTARLQGVSRAFLRQLSAELDSTDADGQLRDTLDELQQLRRQVAELRSEVLTIAGGTAAEGKQVMRELKGAQNAIMPPNLLAAARATNPPPAEVAAEPVYRPPSLFPEAAEARPVAVNGTPRANGPTTPAPIRLPQRLDVVDDPD
jgi:sec-independent protein translocase protein TatB